MEVVITQRLANGGVLIAESGDRRFVWYAHEPDVVYDDQIGRKVYSEGNAPRRCGCPATDMPHDAAAEEALRFLDLLLPIVQAGKRRQAKEQRLAAAPLPYSPFHMHAS
ncbi:hypothetical protein [Halomonas sp. I5-271120]|uniref:hypothetical protein n=1 Tax=Halomonas sp. I5-271120 TaxID=3061632 RepID=UPI0027150A44|nr:hypothetical protein [Halomonas sp. I5-271120]